MSGVSVKTLRTWAKDEGLNLGDIPAVMARAGKVERDVAPDGLETYTEARRRKMIASADMAHLQSKREAGELVSLTEVQDAMATLGFELKARLLAIPSDMAVLLVGMDEAGIHATLQKRMHSILAEIHENAPLP